METLQYLADSTNIPLLTAFILGLMTALSPCPLAMNITAPAYLSKELTDKRRVLFNGLFYTLGRMFSYTALAAIIFFGASKLHVARWFQQIDGSWIGIALIVFGILMLDLIRFDIPFLSRITTAVSSRNVKRNYLIGVAFALAFCPYSAVLYFGGLIPLMLGNSEGLSLPPLFALATGLPVIVIAWLLAFSIANVGKFYNKVKSFEKGFRRMVALVFILTGIYYILINN